MSRIKMVSQDKFQKAVDVVLECDGLVGPVYPGTTYTRLQDDRDGHSGSEHQLAVHLAEDGDMHLFLPYSMESLRFRNYFGGGSSLRVHKALLLLAEAIRRDNEEKPQGV